MRTYRELFGIREFRVLFGARAIFMVGVVVSNLALGTVVFSTTGSPVLTAIALFGGPLVSLVTSQFLLSGSDLLRPRTAMVLTGLSAGGTDLLQLIPGLGIWWRLAILALGYAVLAATSGTVIALLRDIVPSDAFVLGRSTLNLTVGGMQVVGNSVGALLLAAMAPTDLFWLSGTFSILGALVVRLGLRDRPPRAEGRLVRRTREVNRLLLGSRVIRPVYLMMWVPNGLVVGVEALYIPYSGHHAGWLFAATAFGMLAGDVVVGRFVPPSLRDRLILPLRLLLAVPFLALVLHPPVWVAAVLGGVAAFGYPAALPLQERLVGCTPDEASGQVFGLASTGLMVGQALGAVLAGAVAHLLGSTSIAAAHAGAVMAVASLVATGLLVRGLRRSEPVAEVSRA